MPAQSNMLKILMYLWWFTGTDQAKQSHCVNGWADGTQLQYYCQQQAHGRSKIVVTATRIAHRCKILGMKTL